MSDITHDPLTPCPPPALRERGSAKCVSPAQRFWRQGEPLVWATGAALAAILLMVAALLVVVMVNGLGVFWPAPLAEVRLADGKTTLGVFLRSDVNPSTGVRTLQFKTANRDLEPQRQDFHWYPEDAIEELSYPPDVYVLERTANGDLFGYLERLHTPSITIPDGADLHDRFRAALGLVRDKAAREVQPIAKKLAALSARLQGIQEAAVKLEYRKMHASAGADTDRLAARQERLAELRAEQARIKEESDQWVARQQKAEQAVRENVAVIRDGAGRTKTVALVDVVRAYQPNRMDFWAKTGHYLAKLGELLWAEPRESNTEGGLFPAIFGTVMLVFLMAVTCFPLGVLAGIYLGEYARDGLLVRAVRIAVNNLAGIPSIVYGIFGLGFFIYKVGRTIDIWFFPERFAAGIPTFGTGGILWASMTLGLLTVPVVIVATEESLRAIPRGVREGSYALGATKFQTLRRILVPMASPGIMTGFILAMARAAGEVAPLMITGVVKLAPDLPMDGSFPFFHLDRKFMHLGFHIYDIGFQSPNVEATKPMVYVTTLVLLLIVLGMTSAAISWRNRMRKRFQLRTM